MVGELPDIIWPSRSENLLPKPVPGELIRWQVSTQCNIAFQSP